MGLLSTYKWNEDLFKHFTIKPNGKNHGFIVLLDWSGSMGGVILNVVKQMYTLTSFFRRIGVPFDGRTLEEMVGSMALRPRTRTPLRKKVTLARGSSSPGSVTRHTTSGPILDSTSKRTMPPSTLTSSPS